MSKFTKVTKIYLTSAQIDENGHAVLEAVDAKSIGVQDVKANDEPIVVDGVANIPVASKGHAGVVKINENYGINIYNDMLTIQYMEPKHVDSRTGSNRPLCINLLDYAVKAAMCDGKGAQWTADEQAAARERIGCYNGYTVLMDSVIEEEASSISFILPNNTVEFIAYFELYDTVITEAGITYLFFDNAGNVNPNKNTYSIFGSGLKIGAINNVKGVQKCVILNDEDVCVEYAALSVNQEATNQSQNRSGRVAIAKRTSNKVRFYITAGSYPIGTRFLVLVRCK